MNDSLFSRCAGDAAECCGTEASAGLREGRRVGYVEEFATELSRGFAGQVDVLDQGEVEIAICRSSNRVSRSIANDELWRGFKCIGVEEVRWGALR